MSLLGPRSLTCTIGGIAAATLLVVSACGGHVIEYKGGDGGQGGDRSDLDGSGGDQQGSGGSFGTGGSSYVEPVCSTEEPPPTIQECDPEQPDLTCGAGLSCLPYLEYPAGAGCGEPGFGTVCVSAGTAGQGELCGTVGSGCAPGFMCVVGAAGGKRCGQICQPIAAHNCPNGLVCGETDVQGYGVCF